MDKSGSAELLNAEVNNYKIVSLDSLNSDSKSSSLNSKHGQESVCNLSLVIYDFKTIWLIIIFLGKLG